jgi:PTH1 family peptidyl-tRNA hydrolase
MMVPATEMHISSRRRLVVGLGNPGKDYVRTRHNAGFMVIDKLAADHGIALNKRKFNTLYGSGRLGTLEAILAKPLGYMNRSGPPVRQLSAYYRIPNQDVLVVHDDIDLVFGRIKIKEKGGHGGHNGIKSLITAFGDGDFRRVRIGVGRPSSGRDAADHVLGRFGKDERAELDRIITLARDAVVTVLMEGVQSGMNQFNSKQPNHN